MLEEALSAPDCVAGQLAHDADRYAALGAALRGTAIQSALTVARGSSDHAAGYCAYLTMARLGRIVASLPMSLVTLQKSPLITRDKLAIAVSQSGQSPDVIEPIRYFRDGGATTVALVNDIDSPLAAAAEWAMPLRAGKETSVAATKSFTMAWPRCRTPCARRPASTGRPRWTCWRRRAPPWSWRAASAFRSRRKRP
jgi:glucosamine--fructose-6-phosphate aminotransferase (isomerizing)